MLAALTAVLIFSVPFSSWPGGSTQILTKYWLKSAILFFILAGNVVTLRWYQWVTRVICLSVGTVLLATHVFGVDEGGRLESEGALNNPNDLASHLLTLIPFALIMIRTSKPLSFSRGAALAIMGATVVTVLKTGSRSGLVTLIVFGLYLFFRGSIAIKALMIAVASSLVMIAPFITSVEAMERYLSFFGRMSREQATSRQVEYAEGSADSRLALLKHSLIATITHPIVGVGPGQFGGYIADKQPAGVGKAWPQTHNSFTQMSSEVGLIAGLLYLGLVIRAFASSRLVSKTATRNGNTHLAVYGDALTTSVLCFSVAAFFGNYAYFAYVPLLAACGESLRYIASTEAPLAAAIAPLTASRINPARRRAS
jgi:O-antigen ligase